MNKFTILLIEDEKSISDFTSRILSSHGYRVRCAIHDCGISHNFAGVLSQKSDDFVLNGRQMYRLSGNGDGTFEKINFQI